jgi:hypothetical protein
VALVSIVGVVAMTSLGYVLARESFGGRRGRVF